MLLCCMLRKRISCAPYICLLKMRFTVLHCMLRIGLIFAFFLLARHSVNKFTLCSCFVRQFLFASKIAQSKCVLCYCGGLCLFSLFPL